MSNEFLPADVGRDLVAGGGLARITGYTDGEHVTVEILAPFPVGAFDSGAWTILGSPQTSCVSSTTAAGSTSALTFGTGALRTSDVGRFIRINGGLIKITSITDSSHALGLVYAELAAAVLAPAGAWTLEGSMWGGVNGYPRCGATYQQRLFVAGSPGFPNTVWGSITKEYFDFTLGDLDTDAFAYALDDDEMHPIMHLARVQGLVALTTGGEWSIRGPSDGKPITPTAPNIKDQTAYGSAPVAPVKIGGELYVTQRGAKKVRAISLSDYDSERYVAPDIAVLAEHITRPGITSVAYQAEPDAMLYAARRDGQLAALTADRDQDVFAWARQVTQGNVEAVETAPMPDGTVAVFVLVARVVDGHTVRYIERFDDLMTDCALIGTSDAGASTWSNLDHLEGRRVQALADGVYQGEFTVEGGAITLPRAAFRVEIGLAYVTTVQTLTPEVSAPVGSLQGHRISEHAIWVKLLDTIGCTINLQQLGFRQTGLGVLDRPPAPFTGTKLAENLGWSEGTLTTLIQQTLPYRFHLLGVVHKFTANEG